MKRSFTIIISILSAVLLHAQEHDNRIVEKNDTLVPAVKVDHIKVARDIGHMGSSIKGIKAVITPLGEGDPIKWVQALPGVTTGADGTTSMFIRGGNMGNNLVTLDGVPIYGYSHILGMTTVVPQAVLSGATLSKGGFDGSESNFTAGHVRMDSKVPVDGFSAEGSLNNFLVGAHAEGTWKRFSGILSTRISPLTLEYAALKGALPKFMGGLDQFKARVGDVYGKFRFDMNDMTYMELSGFRSFDKYTIALGEDSNEQFGWNNLIGIFRINRNGLQTMTDFVTSYNVYDSFQYQDKMFRGVMNHLDLKSDLREFSMAFNQNHSLGSRRWYGLGYGARFNHISIAPGHASDNRNPTRHFFMNFYLQPSVSIPDIFSFKGFARTNFFSGTMRQSAFEYGVSTKVNMGKHVAFEATYDDLSQFYHTLEGLPTGWSLDMIVPSNDRMAPERSRQLSVGISSEIGNHSFSVAGFGKRMNGLVYFKYSQALFSGALLDWSRSIDTGNGDSYGGEFMYEYQSKDTYVRVGYTLSKTNRYGFMTLNDGAEFHARFDRTHVLNLTATWRDFTAALTWQSGNWENGASEKFLIDLLPDGTFTGDYYSTFNNFRMPAVFRLDLGYRHTFTHGIFNHEVSVGVCNVTNHFNPFMLYFDAKEENWKGLCLLPIMPNFSYIFSIGKNK